MKDSTFRVIIIIVSSAVILLGCAAFAATSVMKREAEKIPNAAASVHSDETTTPPTDLSTQSEPETEWTTAQSETETETETDVESESESETASEGDGATEPSESDPLPVDPSYGTKSTCAERAVGAAGSSRIVIDFAGDVMLANDRNDPEGDFNVFAATADPSYFLSGVGEYFTTDDFTVVNLENVVTDRELTRCEKNYDPAYWYCSATRNLRILTSSSVEAVTVANNHTGDYGQEGYSDTKAALEKYGLLYGSEEKTLMLEKDGFRISVICCGLWSDWNTYPIVARVQSAAAYSDYQIVYYHGGTEYLHGPEEWKVAACKAFIDAGADCVVGTHPHVIQPVGRYRGVDIVYSLGNFCAGDFVTCENRTFIYRLNINLDGGTVVSSTSEVVPCYVYTGAVNDFRPVPISDPSVASRLVDFLDWIVDEP